jgi:hypothetical protein
LGLEGKPRRIKWSVELVFSLWDTFIVLEDMEIAIVIKFNVECLFVLETPNFSFWIMI